MDVDKTMQRVKATIITGFLGSGKTTLLNEIISGAQGERIAIIVNEYGEVGIDGQLVLKTEDEVIELNNGCICCTVRTDLIEAISRLLASGRKIDRFMIETSGLADPAPVIQSFVMDDSLARDVQLDAIVTVVDALHVTRQLSCDEAQEQIAFADVILLNKCDLVDEDSLRRLEGELTRRNPFAHVIRMTQGKVNRSAIIDIGAFDLQKVLSIDPNILEEHTHEHDDGIGCYALKLPGALDQHAFNTWINRLVQDFGQDLLRMKGVLHFSGEARRFVFHSVHMTLEGRPGKVWEKTEPRLNAIVFIGRNLDQMALEDGFTTCFIETLANAE